ncbi:chitin synthase [Pancytospora epiphaga]|nr:chitin synthase [Pancytospora epiphaga]
MLSQAEMLRNNSRSALPSQPIPEDDNKPSFFNQFSNFMTFLIPDWMIHRIGGMSGEQIQAWREKVTLCLLIFFNCCFLGMLTYGVNRFICTGNSNQLIYSKLKPETFKGKGTIVGNGGIYYSDSNYGFDNKTHMFTKNSDACKKAFKKQLTTGKLSESDFSYISDLHYTYEDVSNMGLIVIGRRVYDPTHCNESYFKNMIEKSIGGTANTKDIDTACLQCFKDTFYCGKIASKTNGCVFGDILLWVSTVIIFSLIIVKFFLAMFYAWYSKARPVSVRGNTPVILQVTCYSEGEEGLRLTLDSLTELEYNEDYKLIVVISDGDIKGQGNNETTPEILRRICDVDECDPQAYVSLAPGFKRYNRATVHAGTYEKNGKRSKVLLINKCGNPEETSRKGNRGKRDSQVIIMSFFSRLFYKERLCPLDHAMYRKMSKLLPACKPEDFEILLMVDADTVVNTDALVKMVSAFEHDPKIMGLCGETQIVNKSESWVTRIQVFEYYISHHLAKNFESVFGGVTCLPGCFCIYRLKITTDDHGNIKNHSDRKLYENEMWSCVPILANPMIVAPYSVYEARTLHEKNLLHLGEDRYLTTLLMKNFYKRKLIFLAAAKCRTCVPADYATLRSQRRRWINSTIHNMFELVVVDKLCGTFCCSMQFIIFFELFGTLTLPAAIIFTGVLLFSAFTGNPAWIPLVMLGGILGLPAVLIMFTTFEISYWYWLVIYIFALPIWNFALPVYAFWKFDDFSWGDTRKIEGGNAKDETGIFDPATVKMTHLNENEEM